MFPCLCLPSFIALRLIYSLVCFPLVVNTIFVPPQTKLQMDFEHAKSPNFMDSMDTTFTYMDHNLDYLQPYSHSPTFGVPIGRMLSTITAPH